MTGQDPLENYINDLQQKLLPLQNSEKAGSIRWHIKWYRDRFPSRRLWYRLVGLVTIAIALIATVLAWYGADGKTLIAALLPLSAAISAFFSLKAAWSGYYLAQLNLRHVLEIYELELIAPRRMAKAGSDEEEIAAAVEEAIASVNEATKALLAEANKIINEETQGFFKGMKLPAVTLPGK